MLDEKLVEKIITELKYYRPGLTKEYVENVVKSCLKYGTPLSETAQDIWIAYKNVKKNFDKEVL